MELVLNLILLICLIIILLNLILNFIISIQIFKCNKERKKLIDELFDKKDCD